jgi:hypothetical protein
MSRQQTHGSKFIPCIPVQRGHSSVKHRLAEHFRSKTTCSSPVIDSRCGWLRTKPRGCPPHLASGTCTGLLPDWCKPPIQHWPQGHAQDGLRDMHRIATGLARATHSALASGTCTGWPQGHAQVCYQTGASLPFSTGLRDMHRMAPGTCTGLLPDWCKPPIQHWPQGHAQDGLRDMHSIATRLALASHSAA